MSTYRVREATLDDLDALVHHRVAMFTDMGVVFDTGALADVTGVWLRSMMAGGEYHAWVCETATGEIVAGGGATVLKWPPGPWSVGGDRLAFVYNVYTEPAHRRQGLARGAAPLRFDGLRRGAQPHDVQEHVAFFSLPLCVS